MPEHKAARSKFSALFVLQLAYLLIYPYAQTQGLPFLAFRIFGTVVTALSIYAVSFRRRYLWIALVLAVPAFLHRLLLPSTGGALSVSGVLLAVSFDAFIVFAIFHRVFFEAEPTREAVFGALCIYLLVGFSFSSIYGLLETMQPKAFYLDPAINLHPIPNRLDFIYYSFATVTCLGGAGIAPASSQARSLTVVEALLGVLYLAVLISRLLNAYHARVNAGAK